MHRVWIALAALLGGAAGLVVAFLVGIEATGSPECDGPCFEKWDEVSYVSYAMGAICALVFGFIARTVFKRRLANRNAEPSP